MNLLLTESQDSNPGLNGRARNLKAPPDTGWAPTTMSGWSSWDLPLPSRNVNMGQEISQNNPELHRWKPTRCPDVTGTVEAVIPLGR